ncbi:methyltransferase family protein [Brumimicrobium mesophilum]|uniref:methyltransferase family protein n=1 Tax=Brumimicrobium mesophilum TaxID=392717 RepID=UPI000D142F8D|nr:methyltransferase [Brumimicrobium mesophilum]
MAQFNKFFKPTKSKNTLWILTKTYLQTSLFWIIFLIILPFGIRFIEAEYFGFAFSPQKVIGTLLFIGFSLLALYSAFLMSSIGKGTPLPTDCAVKLVKSGTYKVWRNPMAVSGIGQGISIGIYFGSTFVVLYAISGAILWHILVRPLEEKDLLERFGEEYLKYKNETKNWIPNFKRNK